MNALYIFDSFFKKNWEMRQTLLVLIFVMCSADVGMDPRSSQCYVNFF